MAIVILLVGLPGCGKSTIANYIRDKLGAAVFLSGDIIREEVKRRGMSYTPENDARIAHWFHTQGRECLVVRRLWVKIRKSKRKIIVIDGLRSETQLVCLKKIANVRPIIISIKSSQNVRVRRELKRGRFGKKESVAYVKFRDRLEKGHGILGLMKRADYTIDSTRLGVSQTNARVSKIIKAIIAN
jgi:dephospho-CoA kinase